MKMCDLNDKIKQKDKDLEKKSEKVQLDDTLLEKKANEIKKLQDNVSVLEGSSQKNEKSFPCNECDVETNGQKRLRNHKPTAHEQNVSKDKDKDCEVNNEHENIELDEASLKIKELEETKEFLQNKLKIYSATIKKLANDKKAREAKL